MKRSELNTIIAESIREMIIENNEPLINFMRDRERLNGPIEENVDEWVNKTLSVLNEALRIDDSISEPNPMIVEERDKMLRLINFEG